MIDGEEKAAFIALCRKLQNRLPKGQGNWGLLEWNDYKFLLICQELVPEVRLMYEQRPPQK